MERSRHKGTKGRPNSLVHHGSRERIQEFGEVFTSEREVNAMLNLIKQETNRIESRFLEPACGTGNFIVEVLRRKLDVVESLYNKSKLKYERYAVLAISSIYGIDILEDSVIYCRERLFNYFNEQYTKLYGKKCSEACRNSIKFILERNILCGDSLTMQTVTGKESSIVFSEWSAVNTSMLKRRDYSLASLLESQSMDTCSGSAKKACTLEPIKEFPLIHFLRLAQDD